MQPGGNRWVHMISIKTQLTCDMLDCEKGTGLRSPSLPQSPRVSAWAEMSTLKGEGMGWQVRRGSGENLALSWTGFQTRDQAVTV